jgi:hypothetical protein
MFTRAMQCLVAGLISGAFAPVAAAVVLHGDAVFLVEYYGEDGEFDPPLLGPGSFVISSQPFDPNTPDGDPFPNSEFDVLDFFFSFAGHSWDESDVPVCECYFYPDGSPSGVNFHFDDGVVSWILSWNFDDGNFGFRFDDGEIVARGTSEDGQVSGTGRFNFFLVPEPGSAGLLALGMFGLSVVRRRLVRSGAIKPPDGA